MELKQVDVFLYKVIYLAAAGIIVTQCLGMESMTSLLFTLTFPLTVALWLRSIRKTVTGSDILMLLTALLAVISVLLDLMFSGGSFSFSYVRKVIMFAMTMLFLQCAFRTKVNQDFVRFINQLVDILTIFLILMYFTNRSQMHMLNGYVTRYLTFRFKNPNTTGLFLTCLYMMEAYRLFTRERWYIKLGHILMAAFLAWFVLQTQSRNCLLVLLLFTAASAWLVFRSERSLRITKGWAAMMAWFPLLFLVAYMTLIYTPWIQRIFFFLGDVGKNLDSRVRIWTDALMQVGKTPLLGSYFEISHGTGSAQLHNTHVDLAASYGIPVLILVCVLLTRYLHQKGRFYADKESFSYILAFACAIMLGMGEAALFSGGLGIYLFVGLFLLLSNYEPAEME